MISSESRTEKWLSSHTTEKQDPEIIEKMVMAFTLAESLKRAGLDFIFKGGTSLSLLTKSLERFSIDVDIIVNPKIQIGPYLDKAVALGNFSSQEEQIRSSQNKKLPARHFLFHYNTHSGERRHIVLDVLFEEADYPVTVEIPIVSTVLKIEGDPINVTCPSTECLLGDKLTAFAPHTTGILFNHDKDLEIAKQLFDIAHLFDYLNTLKMVAISFEQIVQKELKYRNLVNITTEEVLFDTFYTSCLIASKGSIVLGDTKVSDFNEFILGAKKMTGYLAKGTFNIDRAILCASKAAYLSATIISKADEIVRCENNMTAPLLLIENTQFNKLNKIYKNNREAFYYFSQALTILGLFN
jgi:predicted nucleotidyltransferase component of viral defense system